MYKDQRRTRSAATSQDAGEHLKLSSRRREHHQGVFREPHQLAMTSPSIGSGRGHQHQESHEACFRKLRRFSTPHAWLTAEDRAEHADDAHTSVTMPEAMVTGRVWNASAGPR
jgi:hypothetical protein